MEFLADILLIAGALGAGIYCVVLSRRLSRFTDLESGVGGAIATLSSQVDDMTKALERSRKSSSDSAASLSVLTGRAEGVAQRLELLVASLHDLPLDELEKTPARAEVAPQDDEPEAEPVPDLPPEDDSEEVEEQKESEGEVGEDIVFQSQRTHFAEAAE